MKFKFGNMYLNEDSLNIQNFLSNQQIFQVNILKNTLQQCIPFIKFYNLTSKEFLDKVLPYEEILPKELYKDLLKTFLSLLDPNSKLIGKSKPRITNLKIVDSPNEG